jgi:hypothetical protein
MVEIQHFYFNPNSAALNQNDPPALAHQRDTGFDRAAII